MNVNEQQTIPLWLADVETTIKEETKLTHDLTINICIVGAGIAGLTAAYLLAKSGRDVVVVDRSYIGGGMTGRSTGHLMSALDDRFYKLVELHGQEKTSLIAKSHRDAIDEIEKIIQEEEIDCDFERVDGYLFSPPNTPVKELEDEYHAALESGCDVIFMEKALLPYFNISACLCFKNQAQFNPVKYLNGLVSAIEKYKGRIFTHTNITNIEDEKQIIAHTDQGYKIKTNHLILATNSTINSRFILPLKQSSYITYVIGAVIPKNSLNKSLYWDTLEAYHYVRIVDIPDDIENQIILIGGNDHLVGQHNQDENPNELLQSWAIQRFPMIKYFKYFWSGQVIEPADKIAYVGKDPTSKGNVYIHTGDSGTGITYGMVGGRLIHDLITDQLNPMIEIYKVDRLAINSLGKISKNILNAALQYSDWLKPAELTSIEEIKSGEGAVVERGNKKIAFYRDLHGQPHECSAVCPHLFGIVRWNPIEKTWDCPCHGSRFDAYGNLMEGPASQGLEKI